jgi:hypothetical protein
VLVRTVDLVTESPAELAAAARCGVGVASKTFFVNALSRLTVH